MADMEIDCRRTDNHCWQRIILDDEHRLALVELARGEVLMGYTDGLTEARSPEGEFYSRRRLHSLLSASPDSAGDLLDRIKDSLFNFIGSAPREDDVTLLAVQRIAPPI